MTKVPVADIDLIIPVYNRADIVGKTLDSVAAQTVRPRSLILVDNNSYDNTADVLDRCAAELRVAGWDVKVLTETTPGAAAARNCGLRAATAEYVMFFDSDDLMGPKHIADFDRALREHPDAEIAGRYVSIHTLNGRVKKGCFSTFMPEIRNIFNGMMATLRYAVKRQLINDVGGWDPQMRGWDDIELGMRLLMRRPKIIKVPGQTAVNVIAQTESITGMRFSDTPYRWENAICKMMMTARENGRDDLLAFVEAKAMMLAADYVREGNTAHGKEYAASIINNSADPRRLRMIYAWHRRFGRFSWVLTLCAFGLK